MKEAQKHLAKGNIDKAIESWIKIAKITPDGNTFNAIGDLYVKKGDKNGAITEYHKAADKYLNEGFSLKALAIHKKVLNINPKDPGALIALGKLNEEKNIVTDAIKYYLAAADVLAKDNKKEQLIEVFDKIVSLAPTNLKLRVKISELYSREGFVPEAAREYSNISSLFMEKNDFSNAEEYLNKAIEIMPNNKDVILAMSALAEKKGDMSAAADYLQSAMDKLGETADILLRKASLLSSSGSIDEATDALSKAVELEPDHIEARMKLSELYQQAGDIMGAWEESKKVVDTLIAQEKPDEAIELLVNYKDMEPVDNRTKLITLYKMASDEDSAFAELYGLHEVHMEQGHIDAAVTALREARDLKPGDDLVEDRLKELEAQITPEPGPEPETEAAAPETEAAEPEAVAGSDAPAAEKTLDEALSEADVFMKYSLYGDARTLLEEMRSKHPESVELHQKLVQAYKELGEKTLAVSSCMTLIAIFKEQGDEAAVTTVVEDALSIDPADARLAEYSQAAPAVDIDAAMSEADFHAQQGLLTEAAEAYRKILATSPGNEQVIARLSEIEKGLSAPGAPAAAPAAPPKPEVKPFMGEEAETDGLFDFQSILGDDADEEPPIDDMDEDVLGIFDEFKKGLAQEISEEDASTHYDLGIAYKEMGVVDDAIKEFLVASNDPNFFSQATSMIGICQMSVGRYGKAIEAFSAALMKAEKSGETWWSLQYDLAMCYELNGQKQEALEIYTNVYNWDVNYREITKKYEALKGELGAPDDAQAQGSTPDAPAQEKPPTPPKGNGKKSRVSYI